MLDLVARTVRPKRRKLLLLKPLHPSNPQHPQNLQHPYWKRKQKRLFHSQGWLCQMIDVLHVCLAAMKGMKTTIQKDGCACLTVLRGRLTVEQHHLHCCSNETHINILFFMIKLVCYTLPWYICVKLRVHHHIIMCMRTQIVFTILSHQTPQNIKTKIFFLIFFYFLYEFQSPSGGIDTSVPPISYSSELSILFKTLYSSKYLVTSKYLINPASNF